ncbi:hypothetical protein ACRRS0_12650 [Agarivorans sp. QJM3NY_29]|uniref:hypothetical protein n=1 Tax=unclassified Agarivorans TaxID=2636026 RepID=UPI003D7C8009
MTGSTKSVFLVLTIVCSAFGLGLGFSYWQDPSTKLSYLDCPTLKLGQCQWQDQQQQWLLKLPGENLAAMLVHPIRLTTNITQPPPLELRLEGVDMYMGEVKVQLKPNADGVYLGQLLLPICNTGKMRWKGYIVSLDPQQPVALSFEVNSQ